MEEKKNVWSTADIIKNRNDWNLASDVELLKLIQSLSEKFVNKSRSTLQLLNSFENDVNDACTSTANISNRFRALSDTQFIESKVRDDSPETEDSLVEEKQEQKEGNENIAEKLNEALNNGIQVLRTQYDIIAVTDSDSEDNESQEVLLKVRNPFMSRRLPYIIGCEEFNKHDHLGLVTSSEDEDDEKDSEAEEEDEEDDDIAYLKKEIPKPEPVKNDFIKSRMQVIRVSSDSEDSEISFSENEKVEQKVAQNDVHSSTLNNNVIPQAPYSFADHLNATLRNMGGNAITPLVDDVFSPPPLPNDDNQSASNDEKSDNESDIFASSRKINESRTKSNIVSDIFDDEILRSEETSRTSRKSSMTTDISHSSSAASASNSDHVTINNEPLVTPKPYTHVPTAKIFNAVNAELSSKFNERVIPKEDPLSSDENDSMFSKSSSSSNRKNPRTVTKAETDESVTHKKISTPSIPVTKPRVENISENVISKSSAVPVASEASKFVPNSRIEDIFENASSECDLTALTAKPSKSKIKPKVVSLFDDDDGSLDELFRSNSKNAKKAPSLPVTVNDSRKGLFVDADDLFLTGKSKAPASEKLATKPIITNVANLGTKKVDLFNDDSDSGDDIFAIINSQKKKSAPNITKLYSEKKSLLFEDDEVQKKSSAPSVRKSDVENKSFALEDDDMSKPVLPPNGSSEDLFASTKKEPKVTSNTFEGGDLIDSKNMRNEVPEMKSSIRTYVNENSRNKGANLFDTDDENDGLFSTRINTEKGTCSTRVPENCDKSVSQIREKAEETRESKFQSEVSPENDVPKKNLLVLKTKHNESSNTDAFSKITNEPSVLSGSKFFEKSNEVKTNLFTTSGETLNSEPVEDPIKSTTTSKSEVLPSFQKITALSRQCEERTPVPTIRTKTFDKTDKCNENQMPVKTAAKLAANRSGLNINVNALLPGSSWSSISEQVKQNIAETEPGDSPAHINPGEPKSEENSSNRLTIIAKERAKVSAKRRPPSRHSRLNKALQSDLFSANSIADTTDDEPDTAYKTASESNSSEKNTAIKETEGKLEETKDSALPSGENILLLPESAPVSKLINYQKERSKLAKQAKKRPPTMSKEKVTTDVFVTCVASKKNENTTANNLGNILITASSSREPPAMIGNDFESLLNDLDKDEDPFNDVIGENKNRNDPIPQIEDLFSTENSSSHPVLKTSLYNSNKASVANDLFLNLESSTIPNVSLSDSSRNAVTIEKSPDIARPSFERPDTEVESEHSEASSTPATIQDENYIKSTIGSKYNKKSTSDLFSFDRDDSNDDLDELFSKVVTPEVPNAKSNENCVTRSVSNKPLLDLESKSDKSKIVDSKFIKKLNLFTANDSEHDLSSDAKISIKSPAILSKASSSSTNSSEASKKSLKLLSKISTDLFESDDDDNELFSSRKKSSSSTKKTSSKSLFEDDSDDDDDDSLFGTISVPPRRVKSIESSKPSNFGTRIEKVRVVKLRSQTVEKDPLTGKIIEQ